MEAADMGDADAQYELGRNLRIEVRLDFTCHCYIIYSGILLLNEEFHCLNNHET